MLSRASEMDDEDEGRGGTGEFESVRSDCPCWVLSERNRKAGLRAMPYQRWLGEDQPSLAFSALTARSEFGVNQLNGGVGHVAGTSSSNSHALPYLHRLALNLLQIFSPFFVLA